MSAHICNRTDLRNLVPATIGAIVHLHQAKPVTNSPAIAREFGRPHKNVLQSLDGLIENGTITRLESKAAKYDDALLIDRAAPTAIAVSAFFGGICGTGGTAGIHAGLRCPTAVLSRWYRWDNFTSWPSSFRFTPFFGGVS